MRAVAILAAGLVLAGLQLPVTAFADEAPTAAPRPAACAPYRSVASGLLKKFHEVPVARAIGGEGKGLVVIFASKGGATWTAISVRAHDRLACIVAAGTDWHVNWVALGEGVEL